MAEYSFSREWGDTVHTDGDHKAFNVMHAGEPMNIGDRIAAAVPGKVFTVQLDGESGKICTEEDWSAQEQADAMAAIATHKAVEDWPPSEE